MNYFAQVIEAITPIGGIVSSLYRVDALTGRKAVELISRVEQVPEHLVSLLSGEEMALFWEALEIDVTQIHIGEKP